MTINPALGDAPAPFQAEAATLRSLEARLRQTVKGESQFDAAGRALYATDSSNYRQVPVGVVYPRDTDDVVAAVAACREAGAPVLSRGAGTSLAGQCCNVAVVLDFSRHCHGILAIDPGRRQARVQPGVVLDRLREEAERAGLTFGPDPATHRWCTIGGMIGNNSCGVHSVMSGKTDDNIDELDILTYDGVRMRVGATPPEALEALIREGGRIGEIYAGLARIRDRYGDLVRAQFPRIPRRVSGYNLDFLLPENGFNVARALVGSEGTCVTVLEATARLVPSPPCRSLLVLGFADVYLAADAVEEVTSAGPIGLEGIDELLVRHSRKKNLNAKGIALLPGGQGWLYVEFGAGTAAEAEAQASRLMERLRARPGAPSMRLFRDPIETQHVWAVRESALGATSFVPGEGKNWEGWEDAAVPPARLGEYLRRLRRLMAEYDYTGSLYGHFGQGCVHTRINFDLKTAGGIAAYRRFVESAADLVVEMGGSLSGEHGDGQSRGELLPRMYSGELMQAFREFKAIWDPGNKMNPGKLISPYRLDEHLRVQQYHPAEVRTHFAYPVEGSLADAAMRCVGVGKCRKTDGGAMCPSYMATGDERHTTRGRARLLFEMLQGEVVTEGFRSEAVKEALDLCLSCKSCKSECPTGVDMAAYKAEFLAHYYEGRRRPLRSYAFGLINHWGAMAEYVPQLANFFMTTPPFGPAIKWALGVAPERRLPAFAARSFRRSFIANQRSEARRQKLEGGSSSAGPPRLSPLASRPESRVPSLDVARGGPEPVEGPNPESRRVLLWSDCSNNYFHPEVARAAVAVLEHAGFTVDIPRERLCCGRPLYDHGMLTAAKRRLVEILESLRAEIEAGTPIIGLEPSCISVFRDELLRFFPDDPLARKLSQQALFLTEFLVKSGAVPAHGMQGRAIVHPHCHERASLCLDDDIAVLKATGLDLTVLDAGCCGMAGAFGFERECFEVSRRVGERVLLPAVRAASPETYIVTNGFSCREQITQLTGRRVWHVAELLAQAMGAAPPGGRDRRTPSAAR
jgi:FAD/FMN-containing dehydrogenase/Fe-S oxidoreductase